VAIEDMETRVRDCRKDVYRYFREELSDTMTAASASLLRS
jgi:hypothetical protein